MAGRLNALGRPLLQHKIRVKLGGELEVTDLRCEFKVKKNLKAHPNTCEIRITNLAERSRRLLQSKDITMASLEAGYESTGMSLLFRGQVRRAYTTWSGPDCTTIVTTGDSEKEMQESHIQATYAVGTKEEAVLIDLAKALGVGPGNVHEAAARMRDTGAFSKGTVFSGNAARCMTDFCRSFGLEWSVQNGILQILEKGQPVRYDGKSAIVLNPGTGLESSPSVDVRPASKETPGAIIVKCKTRLIPDIAPGRIVILDSRECKGSYRIEEIEMAGDTHSDTWGASITLGSY